MRVELYLRGLNFYPSRLNLNNPEFARVSIDTGSIGSIGRYRGIPIPYGYCYVITPDNLENNEKINWMCNYLLDNKELFTSNGCTDMSLWIYWEGVQGNMYFTKEEIKIISKCDIGVSIDYIQLES